MAVKDRAESKTANKVQYVPVDVVVKKEDTQYASWCPTFDIASCGDTAEKAVENLTDALDLYLNTLEEIGDIERVFSERKIKFVRADETVLPSTFVTQQKIPFRE